MVELIDPDQITLVPDSVDQITSDHGWFSGSHDDKLKNIIEILKTKCTSPNISLFIDNLNGVEYANEMGAGLIEIHTGNFSKAIEKNDESALLELSLIHI